MLFFFWRIIIIIVDIFAPLSSVYIFYAICSIYQYSVIIIGMLMFTVNGEYIIVLCIYSIFSIHITVYRVILVRRGGLWHKLKSAYQEWLMLTVLCSVQQAWLTTLLHGK